MGATISSAPLYVIDISSINRRGKNGVMPQVSDQSENNYYEMERSYILKYLFYSF